MKYLTLLLAAVILPVLLSAQTIVTGTSRKGAIDNLSYTIRKADDIVARKETPVWKNDTFRIEVPSDEQAIVTFTYQKGTSDKRYSKAKIFKYTSLIVLPGDRIHLHLNTAAIDENGFPRFLFSGSNAEGHVALQNFRQGPLRVHLEPIEYMLGNIQKGENLWPNLKARIETYHQPFRELLAQGSITPEYYRAATHYIEAKLIGLLAYKMTLNETSKTYRIAEDIPDQYILADSLLAHYPPVTNQHWMGHEQLNNLKHALWSQMLQEPSESFTRDTTLFVGTTAYTIPGEYKSPFRIFHSPYGQLQTPPAYDLFINLFVYQLYSDLQVYLVPKDQAPFQQAYAYFKAAFPENKYVPLLDSAYADNRERYQAIPETPDNYVESKVIPPVTYPFYEAWEPIILEGSESMADLTFNNDTINLQKGLWYVDVWASWCNPCLQHQQFNQPLDQLLDEYGARRLYISIDEFATRERWLQTVYYSHLGGFHVLANDQLRAWLFDTFGSDDSMMVPRYLLLKEGKIIDFDAPAPPDWESLESKLHALK